MFSLITVGLHDNFENTKYIFLILDLCRGGDLSTYIKKYKRLDEGIALSFLRQLCDGLYFLYERSIIHRYVAYHNYTYIHILHNHLSHTSYACIYRDLKPANVLLSESSEYATLKLADFGFAKHLAEASLAQTQCGSPLYMVRLILHLYTTTTALYIHAYFNHLHRHIHTYVIYPGTHYITFPSYHVHLNSLYAITCILLYIYIHILNIYTIILYIIRPGPRNPRES